MDNDETPETNFAMEKHLEESIVENWEALDIGDNDDRHEEVRAKSRYFGFNSFLAGMNVSKDLFKGVFICFHVHLFAGLL